MENKKKKWIKITILVVIALVLLVVGMFSQDESVIGGFAFISLFFTLSRMSFKLVESNKKEKKEVLKIIWLVMGSITSVLTLLFTLDILFFNFVVYNYITQGGNIKVAIPIISISFVFLQIALEAEKR